MSTTGVGSTSWLNSYDPTSPTSLSSLLNSSPTDPSQSGTPAGFDVLFPPSTSASSSSSSSSSTAGSSSGPSQYQQALDAFTVSADTYLIQSALNGAPPLQSAAAFGSTQAYYQGLNDTAQQILSAGQSGNYGSLNALA